MDLLRSLPIGLYLEEPQTWLHCLDPRIKLAWLMGFLVTPILANPLWRIGLVFALILITFMARIPFRVWRKQMVWLLFLSVFIFVLTCIFDDGLAIEHQPRLPSSNVDFPQPTDYQYVLIDQAWLTVTRRSLELAIRVSTLIFTLIYSTNLYLLTTAPEEITAGLETLMNPLKRLGIPVTEIILTLTLSLRFIPLVLEEIQNLIRSVSTRAINWKKLGLRRSFGLWLMLAEKLLENLLLRAEQIAVAMDVRGFTSPNEHQVQWHRLILRGRDWIAVGGMVLFLGGRLVWGS
ncbi:MAG: energy-coupling factor transporter transmembrane component T family protein [Halothece sp.]